MEKARHVARARDTHVCAAIEPVGQRPGAKRRAGPLGRQLLAHGEQKWQHTALWYQLYGEMRYRKRIFLPKKLTAMAEFDDDVPDVDIDPQARPRV